MNLMIRPMIPNISVFIDGGISAYIGFAILLTATIFVAVLLSCYAADRFKGDKKKTAFCFAAFALLGALKVHGILCFLRQ